MRIKSLLLSGVCIGASALMAGFAQAQSNSDVDKVDRLQRQMEQLQEQIKSLKGDMAAAKKKSIDLDAVQGAYGAVAPRSKSPLVKAVPLMEHVKLTLGGFFAGETVYRSRNMTSDESTSFGAVPFPFSPLFNEHEFRASGRATRVTLLAEGNIDPKRKLSGYMETDFFGVGATSNYNQSNSWAPRIRQGYLTYDDNSSGFHFLTGQAWSLLTQNTAGIQPRKENIPLTIEHNYVVGFEFTRNWQARFVQEFGPMFSLGVSVEAPAELVFTGTGATGAPGVTSGSTLNGFVVNFNNAGGSFLGSSGIANTFTTDTVPDVIEKVAFDPGWGHFEVFGLQRFFTDNVFTCSSTTPTGACLGGSLGSAGEKTTTGSGIGGSVLLPLIPSFLDISAQAMAGKGVGRYAAGQLSDVFVGPDGSLVPIKEVSAMGGLVLHPWMGLDIYGYAGFEKASANFFTSAAGGQFGIGNPNLNNFGCTVTTAGTFAAGAALTNCAGNNKMLTDITVGFWQNLYNGDVGRFTAGVQWEMIGRKLFNGLGVGGVGFVAPSTTDNIVMTSIRWYPKYQ